MKKFNLYREVNILLEDFERLNLDDTISVLSWFYDAINYNSMFEDRKISTYIYNKLINAGYSISDDLSSDCFEDQDKYRDLIISQILLSLKKQESFENGLLFSIQRFNEKFNAKETARKMMENMGQYIGTKVICVGVRNGLPFYNSALLTAIEPFKSITIGKTRIPFIGFGVAILKICGDDGFEIYSNSIIPTNYDIQDFETIEKLTESSFGEPYTEILKRSV